MLNTRYFTLVHVKDLELKNYIGLVSYDKEIMKGSLEFKKITKP